jgi:hypothetical protein
LLPWLLQLLLLLQKQPTGGQVRAVRVVCVPCALAVPAAAQTKTLTSRP